jgi:(R,R)-butanediol dehydrogenase / meso-butanediol dehydrogenase / diacetyl reductase
MKAARYCGDRRFSIDSSGAVRPGPDEVRLDVAYCGICGTDLHIYHGAMDKRIAIPQVIGHEMSGTVAELGSNVSGLAVGDTVVVRPLDARGETPADRGLGHICRNLKFMGIDSPGALQSSWTVPQATVHKIPAGVDLKTAALTEPLAVACHDVRMSGIKAGQLAVVLGAGPIGLLIAMVARELGARVALAEIGQYRLEFARKLGFNAFDPRENELLPWVMEASDGSGADVVFEVSGAKAALLGATGLLAPRGCLLLVAIYPQPVEVNLFQVFWKELKLQGARVYEREDYERALELMANHRLDLECLITKVISLDQIQEAFQSLESDPHAMKILVRCTAE